MEQKKQLTESEIKEWARLKQERQELGEKIFKLYNSYLRITKIQSNENF